jgi:hypothetical protein
MDTIVSPARTAEGRFAPGVSGTPFGRPKGSRNRTTLWNEALRQPEEGVIVARSLLDAHGGDKVAKRFCLDRIAPAPKGRFIELAVPAGDEWYVTDVFDAVTRAPCDRKVTPDEALAIGRYLALRKELPDAWRAEDEHARRRRQAAAVADAAEDDAPDTATRAQESSPPLRGRNREGGDAALAEPLAAEGGACPQAPTPTLPREGGGSESAGVEAAPAAPANSLYLQAAPVSAEDGPDRRYYPYDDLHKPRGPGPVRGFRTIYLRPGEEW